MPIPLYTKDGLLVVLLLAISFLLLKASSSEWAHHTGPLIKLLFGSYNDFSELSKSFFTRDFDCMNFA
jgi:hypothetical protein